MARLLATACAQGKLTFPITVTHQGKDTRPDFLIKSPSGSIGVECVEVVPEDWYKIEALRERKYPDAFGFLPRFSTSGEKLCPKDIDEAARGETLGEPWEGDTPERDWAEAHYRAVARKVAMLRAGNYNAPSKLWLLAQDEWRVPVTQPKEYRKAAKLLELKLMPLTEPPCFDAIFICTVPIVFVFTRSGTHEWPVNDVWKE